MHATDKHDTLARVLRSAGRQLIAVDTLREDAATIAFEIARALADSDSNRALRLFIQLSDNLAAEHGASRFALGLADPRPRPDAAVVPPEFLRRRVLIDRDTLASV